MAELSGIQLGTLVLAGFVAGVANVLAGGGSLLTLPLLMWMGLPAPVANASNRISLIFQNSSACVAFGRGKQLRWRTSLRLIAVAAPGAAIGASVAIDVDETLFRRILLGILLFAMWSIWRHGSNEKNEEWVEHSQHRLSLYFSFAAMGFYAGFIQAGLGFLLIASLTVLGGFDFVRTNAVKVAVVLGMQLISIVVFSAAGTVHWWAGLALAVGSASGAWVGARLQMARGTTWVRRATLVMLALISSRVFAEAFLQ